MPFGPGETGCRLAKDCRLAIEGETADGKKKSQILSLSSVKQL